ncbi:hypothetical protein ACFOQM_21200 [Paenibacillus sp. GCM10012307]|uniref:Uncharacterized protein n=1 Tax=Paenibacillus roseus TaxID=2798579 RepID=A0A934JBG3_9BACL|nr:hypothetical protein [Paenibacillus roseus]MBJ6363748.1 hypothetical protein [Paenibacillus roseus]
MSRTVSIRIAAPGDVLANAVITSNGTTLLSGGTRLTKELIEKLKRFGVATISIK